MSKRRKKCVQVNSISYEELNSMNKDKCVKVSLSYLYLLMAKTLASKIDDDNIMELFKKYLDVITMQEFLGEKNYSYCLMKVNDILFLISTLNVIPKGKTRFLKSDSISTFDKYYENLKENYIAKITEINLESVEIQVGNDSYPIRRRIQ